MNACTFIGSKPRLGKLGAKVIGPTHRPAMANEPFISGSTGNRGIAD
jgi:hypothetical protein